jgi:GntR family transcriptional regulator of arabinose operon
MKTTPKYRQIINDINGKIESGSLRPGSKLPTEKELSETYNVSRIVAVNALSRLAAEGKISRTSGRGSFVAYPAETPAAEKRNIAFVLPRVLTPYSAYLSQAVIAEARKNGLICSLCYSENDIAIEEDILGYLSEEQPAGILIYPCSMAAYNRKLISLKAADFPIVLIDRDLPGLGIPIVQTDNKMVTRLAVSHLADHGHTRIALCSHSSSYTISLTDRISGFLGEMADRHIMVNPALITTELKRPEEIQKLRDNIKNRLATAYICLNAFTWHLLHDELSAAGLHCPGDVSVVTVDRSGLLSNPAEEPTHIRQDADGIAAHAVRLLYERIRGKPAAECESIAMAPTLVEGFSTAFIS